MNLPFLYLLKKYYYIIKGNINVINRINITNYIFTIKTLIELGCDFNTPIDDDGVIFLS